MRSLLSLAGLALFTSAAAQDLGPGDLMITAYTADGTKGIAFVPLVDIPAGTALNVTDNGWLATGSFRASEGVKTWTPDADVPAGTEVWLDLSNDEASLPGPVDSFGSLIFAVGGDQAFLYTGTTEDPILLAGISMEGTGWQADATSASTSALPADLVNLGFTLGIERDNARVRCADVLTTGTARELRAAILAAASWDSSDDDGVIDFKASCTWTVETAPATVDDFEDGTPMGWQQGQASDRVTHAPDGLLGGFLRVQALGGGGAGNRMVVFNDAERWTGDWTDLDRRQISLFAQASGADLTLRLIVESADGEVVTTVGAEVPDDGTWHRVALDVRPGAFTGGDAAAVLAAVTRLRIVHNPEASTSPPSIAAVLHLDHITDGPLPVACGDNRAGGGEVCDGADVGDATCEDEGFSAPGAVTCSATCDAILFDACEGTCGDGVVEPGEDCDDSGEDTADCNSDCTEPTLGDGICNEAAGETPLTAPEDCADTCGDDLVSGAEACDGDNLAGGDCTDFGYATPGGLACDGDCAAFNLSGCSAACGNSVTEPGEQCDDGATGSATCTAECVPVVCGDGVCNGEETGATCPADCPADCGDGVATHTEVCDGADLGGQDCTDFGYSDASGLACGVGCDAIISAGCGPTCGDAILEPGEQCDDGNLAAEDGCSAACTVEDGWDCEGDLCEAVCGDGVIVGTEQCDDANTDADDGCSDNCSVESGWLCDDEEPSTCEADTDGDGVPDAEDNCPDVENSDQLDANGDGIGDACEGSDTDDTDDVAEGSGCSCAATPRGLPFGLLPVLPAFIALRRRR